MESCIATQGASNDALRLCNGAYDYSRRLVENRYYPLDEPR